MAHSWRALLLLLLSVCHSVAKEPTGLSRLELEEIAFMRSSLLREVGDTGKSAEGDAPAENAIRKAYRNIARRYKQNIFANPEKFEFQMRILNLARDALMTGSTLGTEFGPSEDDEESNATSEGRELPGGSRMSDDILKNLHSWQEFALEEGVRFDGPETPFFVGHTLHAFNAAFASNWSDYVENTLSEIWPAARGLKLQVALDGSSGGQARAQALKLAETQEQVVREALVHVANLLHSCAGPSSELSGPLPAYDNTMAWIEFQLKISRALRSLFLAPASERSWSGSCATFADLETRQTLLELNLEALGQLALDGPGMNRRDVAEELQVAHTVVAALRAENQQHHCRETINFKLAALEHMWEEYQFGLLIAEVYPLDDCGLAALALFLQFHTGQGGELLTRRAEPDRSVLKALRGLLQLQQALVHQVGARPLSPGHPSELEGTVQWREALNDVEEAVWKGVAFPELHETAGKLLADLAIAGLLPEVLAAALEHPPVRGGPHGATLPHGREPGEVEPARASHFSGLSIPGYSTRPLQVYEERAARLWGNEEVEEHWDPVRLGLSYLDLTPACDLPVQVASCFMSAALWFWRALQMLTDNCGGDAWLETYIFEDLWSVSPEAKRLAMKFGLKRAIMEMVEYAASMADHQLLPGPRLALQRTGYLLLRQMAGVVGTEEDAPKVLQQLNRLLEVVRLNPLWRAPVLSVSDSIFLDIVAGRLHSSFIEKVHEVSNLELVEGALGAGELLPTALTEYALYEAALAGATDVTDVTFARFEVMGRLLHDTNRSWEKVEELLAPAPMRLDVAGFAAGKRPGSHSPMWAEAMKSLLPAPPGQRASNPDRGSGWHDEFGEVRGIRIDMSSGQATLLLSRPGKSSQATLALEHIASMLSIENPGPLHASLDPPRDPGAGIKEYPYHPFQQATAGPDGMGRYVENALLHTALSVQQVASGNEIAMRAPFPLRDCSEGLCRGLPRKSRGDLSAVQTVRTDAWDQPARLMLECNRLQYWQRFSGSTLEVRFGKPAIEVHPGKPLQQLNEELFKSWTVRRLRDAIREIEKQLKGEDLEPDSLPALEKHELVERLLRAAQHGLLLEDEEESSDPLARFSRRFTHHLAAVSEQWRHLARLGPLCTLRAATLILRMQLEQLKDSAANQREAAVTSSSAAQVQELQRQENERWLEVLGDLHGQVLHQLGFVDLDPGRCFEDEEGKSFARCCSVGDYGPECWKQEEPAHSWEVPESPREQELRCCGSRSRGEAFPPSFMASVAAQLGSTSPRRPRPQDLIPAVEAWLQNPSGRDGAGQSWSSKLVQLLAEEVQAADVQQHSEDQASRPAARLEMDLKALGARIPALLPPSPKPGWIPLPPLLASRGRRSLFVTVALTPQLEPIDGGEADAAQAALDEALGPSVELPLEELPSLLEGTPTPADPRVRTLMRTAALLRDLDERADELETSGSTSSEEESSSDDEDLSCGAGGWIKVLGDKALANLTSGTKLKIRRLGTDELHGELGVLEAVLALVGQPGELVTVWKVLVEGEKSFRYFNFYDRGLEICRVAESGELEEAPALEEEPEDLDSVPLQQVGTSWPSCIEANVATPSADGTGLFVNLEALDIKKGCFQDDCSYSDHFACSSPADCARTCGRIKACKSWTFWEAAPATCWLRGKGRRVRREAPGAVSGSVGCQPPQEKGLSAPTLFKLIAGPSGTLQPSLWEEWDLVQVLAEFGHMSLEEIRRAPASHRQSAALRAAALAAASSRCSWRGPAHQAADSCSEV